MNNERRYVEIFGIKFEKKKFAPPKGDMMIQDGTTEQKKVRFNKLTENPYFKEEH